ncbi:MAG TPA: transposase [Ignavibacteriales bacterium]|nr:transposase [Ignavibacteriales bacterium]
MLQADVNKEFRITQSAGTEQKLRRSMPDHVHIFLSYVPTCYIPDMVREIKVSSTEFIKRKGWAQGFQWQESYGVFSYSQSHISRVINYIQHQEEHHRKKTFREEYIKILEDFEIKYEEKSNISPLQGSMGVVGPICYRQTAPSVPGFMAVYGWSCFNSF